MPRLNNIMQVASFSTKLLSHECMWSGMQRTIQHVVIHMLQKKLIHLEFEVCIMLYFWNQSSTNAQHCILLENNFPPGTIDGWN